MAKDIIYIDVEDDITSIIGKVKASKEKIIALVPPKRVGILQSDVNLRLLKRNAAKQGKQLVLITNDAALLRLAGVTGIPVAKNLQSKPEIPEIPALAIDDNDIIDGSDLPVGEHEKTAKSSKHTDSKKKAADSDDLDDINLDEDGTPPAKKSVAPSKVKKSKVPNFDSFRKKLFIGIGAGVALIGLLVWMFVFAPAARIIITAETTDLPVSVNVTLSNDKATSVENNVLQSSTVTLPENSEFSKKSVEFTATGTQEVGEKATGTMKITRTSLNSVPISVPAGTGFSSGNLTFVSTQATTLEGADVGPGGLIYPSKTIPVAAVKIGDEFNLSARSYNPSIAGISATGSAMTGGSSRQVKMVTQTDVNSAAQQLGELSETDAKKALLASINDDQIAIEDSYTASRSDVVSSPAVGAEAPDGKGTVTLKATYSIKTVAKSELKSFLTKKVDSEIENSQTPQRVYDYGVDSAKLTEFTVSGGAERVKVTTIAKVGPKLEADQIKEDAKGEKSGEIREKLKAINGVKEVEVKFSFFWVTRVPNNPDKIEVEFKIDQNNTSNDNQSNTNQNNND